MLILIMSNRWVELWREQDEIIKREERKGNCLTGLRVVVLLENVGDVIFSRRKVVEKAKKRVEKLKSWLNLE